MGLGRSRRDAETAGDLFVGTSGGDQLDHLALPIRDDRLTLMQYSDHAATLTTALRPAYWPDGVTSAVRPREYRCGFPVRSLLGARSSSTRYVRDGEALLATSA